MKRLFWKTLAAAALVALAGPAVLPLTGRAAPAALPNCGHGNVSKSPTTLSGPPDIAQSANGDYTALVWSEGVSTSSAVGTIQLAYSRASTTNRSWTKVTVDGDTTSERPVIAFDPTNSTSVTVAYIKKVGGAATNSIVYKQCTLGGVCSTLRTVRSPLNANYNLSRPQIAVDGAGNPLLVYQEVNNASPQKVFVRFAYINKASGTAWQEGRLTTAPDIEKETNPSIAFTGGKLHVAYAINNDLDPAQELIRYWRGTVAAQAVTADGGFPLSFSPNLTFVSDPDYPTIAAAGTSVYLVWEVKNNAQAERFHLVYNQSTNGGSAWFTGGTQYKYIPSNINSTAVGGPATEDFRQSIGGGELTLRLQPEVTLDADGLLHLAWHEQANGSRRDILYSKLVGGNWVGTPILKDDPAGTQSNVTGIYGDSDQLFLGTNRDNVQASLFFGRPGDRLQVVYVSQTSASWDVFYNGWQLGDGGESDPLLRFQDMDCDTIPDTEEVGTPPVCVAGAFIFGDGAAPFSPDDHYNCDDDGDFVRYPDFVPDFLDTDADGDLQADDKERLESPNKWREYNEPPMTMLPLILK